MLANCFAGNAPKLHELQLLKLPNGTELRIMREVTPEWDEVAVALGFDGARIKTIIIIRWVHTINQERRVVRCSPSG